MIRVALAALLVAACGPGIPGGPTMNNRLGDQAPRPVIQSNDILDREAVTNRAFVKHILVGFEKRSRGDADKLAVELLEKVRAGAEIEPLMAEFSEDPGSAATGQGYEVTPDAKLVFEFKRLGLRLAVGESGLVLSEFGWHIMKRME